MNTKLLFLIIFIGLSNVWGQEFTLTTSASNLTASKATINMPGLNSNPQAIIVATPVGNAAAANPHPLGAWYYNGKWNIFNTDHANMPVGLSYKLKVFLEPNADHFLHIVTGENLSEIASYIDNPALNNNPNAQFQILQNYAPDIRSPYNLNASEAKASYNSASGKWYIANVNGKPLNPNSAYNVVIFPDREVGTGVQPVPTRTREPIATTAKTVEPISAPTRSREPITSSTQPSPPAGACTKEMAYQTVGKWGRQRVDDLAMADNSFPKAEQKAVLAKAQKIVEMLVSANPELVGVDASAKRMIRGDSYFPGGALKFGITSGYAGYFCVPNNNGYAAERRGKIVLGGGGGSSINIFFNDFREVFEEIKGDGKFLTANGEALFYLPKQLDDFKGMRVLQPALSAGIKEAIIITPNNRSPYKPVSREQFIQARIKYYREFYRTLERSSFEPIIAELNLMLTNMSPAERQTQAIISSPFAGKGSLFVSEAKGGKPVVAVDKDFFNSKLPRSAIQLIIVYLDWNNNDIAVAEEMRQFKQNFDFEALKQMLGN